MRMVAAAAATAVVVVVVMSDEKISRSEASLLATGNI